MAQQVGSGAAPAASETEATPGGASGVTEADPRQNGTTAGQGTTVSQGTTAGQGTTVSQADKAKKLLARRVQVQ